MIALTTDASWCCLACDRPTTQWISLYGATLRLCGPCWGRLAWWLVSHRARRVGVASA